RVRRRWRRGWCCCAWTLVARRCRATLWTTECARQLDVVHQRREFTSRKRIAAACKDALGFFHPDDRLGKAQKFSSNVLLIERQRRIAGNMSHGSLPLRGGGGGAHACRPAARIVGEQAFVCLNFYLRHQRLNGRR